MIQLSRPYMTTGKSIALTIQIFVGKVEEGWPDAIWSDRAARILGVLLGGPHGDQSGMLPTGQDHIPIQAGSTLPGSGRSRTTALSWALSCLPLPYSACRLRLTLTRIIFAEVQAREGLCMCGLFYFFFIFKASIQISPNSPLGQVKNAVCGFLAEEKC